mmetsp:Transcript_6967/g.21830  ORF Transcript_6967/g.21830 Transcript_6967/m.21830 type:complete len:302 (-) Transcript_6967:1229-2134(-)
MSSWCLSLHCTSSSSWPSRLLRPSGCTMSLWSTYVWQSPSMLSRLEPSAPAMTTGALYWNRRSPLARLGCAPRSTGSSQTASTRAQSEHAAIMHAMSSWHDCGHIPAFAGFFPSCAHVESSGLLPQTCVSENECVASTGARRPTRHDSTQSSRRRTTTIHKSKATHTNAASLTARSIKSSSAWSHAVRPESRRRNECVFLVSAFRSARCCGAEDGSTKPKTVGCLYNVTKPSPNWTLESACRMTRDLSSQAPAPGAASFNRAASFASVSAFESMPPSWRFSLRPDFESGAATSGGVVSPTY